MSFCRSIVQIMENGDRMGVHACIEISKKYNRFMYYTTHFVNMTGERHLCVIKLSLSAMGMDTAASS